MRLTLGECVSGDSMSDEIDAGAVISKSPAQPEHLILAQALQAVRDGDFSARLPAEWDGVLGKVSDIFNQIVTANQQMAAQLERVGVVVGKQGRTRQRINLGLATGAWADMEESVNALIDDLLWPTTEVTRTIEAVARAHCSGR